MNVETSWDTTGNLFAEPQIAESPLKKESFQEQAPTSPNDILAQAKRIESIEPGYLQHGVIVRFGSPEQSIYVDYGKVEINGIEYTDPMLLPIVDGTLQPTQVAVLQDGKPISIVPDSLASGFAYYGDVQKDKPVIVTYDLESFFKIAQTEHAVVLVVMPHLCQKVRRELKPFDFEQIKYVVNQLDKAGYQQLYMPVLPEQIQLEAFQSLEKNTPLRLLNQFQTQGDSEFLTLLDKDNNKDEVQAFLTISIEDLPQKDALPKGHLAKPFKMDDGSWLHILDTGLYQIKEKQDENGETKQIKIAISKSLIILGEARSLKNDNWKRVIQFHDKDRTLHTLVIPYEHFMGEAQDALKLIASHGLMPPRQTHKKNVFIHYIQDYPIEQRFRCVDRTGWYGNAFVTTHKTYGNHEDEQLLFNSEMKDPYSTMGSLAGWQELSRLIEPHALAVLSFACAFSGQLVTPLDMESGGFHIYGTSTDGKSTITKAACSVWGKPKDVSKSWRTTDNALENDAELRNDNFLNLDELRQAVPKAVSDIVYMLTGAQGKARGSKSGKNRETKQFNLMYTSTGEITLENHLRRGGIEMDAGLLLRFAHIPSDAGKGFGVFETINYGNSSSDVGNRINELSSKHYGYAGVLWLEYLTANKDEVMLQAQTMLDDFISQHTTKNSQAARVLRRFALVAVAGELATQAGITTWQQGRAFEAVGQCFNTWLATLGNGENLEETAILEHFKGFFEAHGTSRFESLTVVRQPDGEVVRPRIHNRVGYYDADEGIYLVSSTMFKQEMCIGINEANAKKVLKTNGWLECEEGRYTKRVGSNLPDGTRPTMMHFKVRMMQNFNAES